MAPCSAGPAHQQLGAIRQADRVVRDDQAGRPVVRGDQAGMQSC